MTYHARVEADGSFTLPASLAQEIGAGPGDRVRIEHDAGRLVVCVDAEPDEPLARLREALRGYSVDRFIAERRVDSGE